MHKYHNHHAILHNCTSGLAKTNLVYLNGAKNFFDWEGSDWSILLKVLSALHQQTRGSPTF